MHHPLYFSFLLFILISTSGQGEAFGQISLADTQKINQIMGRMPQFIHQDIDSSLVLLNHADSLLQQLKAKYDFEYLSVEFNIDLYKGFVYSQKMDFENALYTVQGLLSDSDIQGYEYQRGRLYNLQGAIYSNTGDGYQAKKSYFQALQIDDHWQTQIDIYNNLGNLELVNERLPQALTFYKKALLLQREHEAPLRNQGVILLNIGRLYLGIDSLEKATKILDSTEALFNKVPALKPYLSRIYEYRGLIALKRRDTSLAYQLHDSALVLAEKNENHTQIAAINLFYAEQISETDCNSQKIAPYLEKVERLTEEFHLPYKLNILGLKGNMAACKQNYSLAKQYYVACLIEAQKNETASFELFALEELSKVFETEGNEKEALKYYRQYHTLFDSLKTDKELKNLDNVRLEIDLEKSQFERKGVQEKLTFSEKQAKLRLYFLGLAIAIILLTILGLVYISLQRNKILQKSQTIFRQNNRLKNLFAERQTLIKLISHDLRSPLIRIQLKSATLHHSLSETEVAEEVLTQLQEIDAATIEIGRFSNKILESFQLDEQANADSTTPISLNQELSYVIAQNDTSAGEKKIHLVVDPLSKDREIPINPDALQLILNNLLSNAIKYSPSGSTIEVTAQELADSFVFDIRDQGPGFSSADFENMFIRFQTLSAQPTGGEVSLGMGLYLAKKLSTQLGFSLEIYNRAEKGAVAKLSLPKRG